MGDLALVWMTTVLALTGALAGLVWAAQLSYGEDVIVKGMVLSAFGAVITALTGLMTLMGKKLMDDNGPNKGNG